MKNNQQERHDGASELQNSCLSHQKKKMKEK